MYQRVDCICALPINTPVLIIHRIRKRWPASTSFSLLLLHVLGQVSTEDFGQPNPSYDENLGFNFAVPIHYDHGAS